MSVVRSSLCHLLLITTITLAVSGAAQGSENSCSQLITAEEQLIKLQLDNSNLALKLKQLESIKTIPVDLLPRKKALRLKEIAGDVKNQRLATSDFEGFVKWMSLNLAGYNRYIQAGSYAAVIGRVLPIPYAGQASVFAKFVAQFTVALNDASVSITNYLGSSQKFVAMADAIDLQKPLDEKALSGAARFADEKLLKDMNDAQLKLSAVSELSSGALSFLESLNHYVSGTDEYWNKVKGVFKKDIDPKEKSYISESTSSLKGQAGRFNGKLKAFADLGKETASVKALAVYDELMLETQTGLLK